VLNAQQTVLAVETLGVIAVAPRFAVARAQMLDAVDASDPAFHLYLPHALLEQALAAAREDERRHLRFVARLRVDGADQVLLPLRLPLPRRARRVERPVANVRAGGKRPHGR
jgi:hypothetical protein